MLAFIEGFYVLAIELFAAKLVAPYLGASLYVWSSIIGFTIASLAIGYFVGGRLSARKDLPSLLLLIFLLVSAFFGMMPIIISPMLDMISGWNAITSIMLVCGLLVFPPLFLLGITSPVIIQLLSKNLNHSGKSAGTVYGLSTVGGILNTFIIGFYVIPKWGITNPIIVLSFLLVLIALVLLFDKSRLAVVVLVACVLIFQTTYITVLKKKKFMGNYRILHHDEGMQGQIKVTEALMRDGYVLRMLMVNHIFQSVIHATKEADSDFFYTHILSTFASMQEKGSQALLFGFGAGSMATELTKLGFYTDAVEIDDRLFNLSKQFFGFNDANTKFINDDARHYLETTGKKYDLIIFDLSVGENIPSHLYTLECFTKVKSLLNPDGFLLINFPGYISGKRGLVARSVYRTLLTSGYEVNYYLGKEKEFIEKGLEINDEFYNTRMLADIVFIAASGKIDYSKFSVKRVNPCCKKYRYLVEIFLKNPISNVIIDTDDALLFSDDKPMFPLLYASTALEWRRNSLRNIFQDKKTVELKLLFE